MVGTAMIQPDSKSLPRVFTFAAMNTASGLHIKQTIMEKYVSLLYATGLNPAK